MKRAVFKTEYTLADDDKVKLYERTAGWEDRLDEAEAARLKAFKETHVQCANKHVRPKSDDRDDKCPVCGSVVPFCVD